MDNNALNFSAFIILSKILYVFNKFNLLNSSVFFDFDIAYIFILEEYCTHIWSIFASVLVSKYESAKTGINLPQNDDNI